MSEEIVPVNNEDALSDSREMEDDFAEARKNLKAMITASASAIENLTAIAEDSEHPRAFEVLATLLTNASAMSGQLMELHQRRKNIRKKEPVKGGAAVPELPAAGTTNVFIGTSSELQKRLAEKLAEKVAPEEKSGNQTG